MEAVMACWEIEQSLQSLTGEIETMFHSLLVYKTCSVLFVSFRIIVGTCVLLLVR